MNKKMIINDGGLPEPTRKQIKKAIRQSGYLLEQRICPIIDKNGFFTIPNDQYQDQDTGKSREIDVYAIKLNSLYKKEFEDTFKIILLIECKNNSTPVVFFSHISPTPKGVIGYIDLNGYPDGIYDEETKYVESIEDYFNFNKFHHNYKVEWFASQFCQLKSRRGGKKQKIEWAVSHEGLYESIESLVKATNYYSSELKKEVVLDEESKDIIHLGMIYPILLFAGKIFDYRIYGKKYRLYKKKHLMLYKTIESKTIRGTYHIDVIQEDYLQKFLDIIKEENRKIVKRLKSKRKLLKDNVQRNYEEQKINIHKGG